MITHKQKKYITGRGIVAGEGLSIARRRNNVVRRRNNVVKKSGKGILGSMLGNLICGLIGGATGNKDRGAAIGQGAGAFYHFRAI